MPFRDFDAGRKARQPLQFQLDGKPWLLPASPNATKVIAFMSYDRSQGKPDDARLLLEDLFDGKIEELRRQGMDWQTLQELESWALSHWGLGPPLEKPLMERIQAVNTELVSILEQGEREGVFAGPLAGMMRELHQALGGVTAQAGAEAQGADDPKSPSTSSPDGGTS